MKREKVEVTIKTGSGVELRIESDRRTVQEIITEIHRKEEQRARFREDFMKRREVFKRNSNEKNSKNTTKGKSSKKSKKDIIVSLIDEGFFDSPKSIGDVQKAMSEKGYHYPSTSLSPLLLRLVQQHLLIRNREEKNWRYVKKK